MSRSAVDLPQPEGRAATGIRRPQVEIETVERDQAVAKSCRRVERNDGGAGQCRGSGGMNWHVPIWVWSADGGLLYRPDRRLVRRSICAPTQIQAAPKSKRYANVRLISTLASSCATGGDLAPIAFIWTCRARRRGSDRERVRPVLRRTRGRRHHPRRQRAEPSGFALSSRPRELVGYTPGPAGLLRHHARGRGGGEGAVAARQPGGALSPARAGIGAAGSGQPARRRARRRGDDQPGRRYPYTVYPLPGGRTRPIPHAPPRCCSIEARMPGCRAKADALRTSFAARRTFMQQCLR